MDKSPWVSPEVKQYFFTVVNKPWGRSLLKWATQILPRLYVGNLRASRDEQLLKQNNITHILSLHHCELKPLKKKKYLCITALDVAWQDLSQYFDQCIEFIHQNRLKGNNVLVHCLVGRSRSVTIAAAYIMTVTSMGWQDAITIIREARSCASPNFAFQLQLQRYEFEEVKTKRKKLKEKYANSPFTDEEDCRQILYSYKKRTRPHSYHSGLNRVGLQNEDSDSKEVASFKSCEVLTSSKETEDNGTAQSFEKLGLIESTKGAECSSLLYNSYV